MNESCSGVAIAHLGWDLALVSDEKRAGQRSVVRKRAVNRTGGTRSDPGEYVGWRLTLLRASGRTFRRIRGEGKNRRCRENQNDRRPFGSSAVQ